jgi:hypothetical protein
MMLNRLSLGHSPRPRDCLPPQSVVLSTSRDLGPMLHLLYMMSLLVLQLPSSAASWGVAEEESRRSKARVFGGRRIMRRRREGRRGGGGE